MAEMTEEQIAALQEKIKSMNPEELKEFQKQQCIFCHIISGKVQSKKIYADDKAMAILDINPANPGHLLIMPKEHYAIMPQIPEDILAHLFILTKALSNVVLRSLGVDGTNIIVANGVAAGQKAQHFMIHLIPRKQKDGLDFELPQRQIAPEEMDAIAARLAAKMADLTGKKPAIVEADFTEKQPQAKPPAPEKKEEKKEEKVAQASPKKQERTKGEGANLDDIAKLLGAK